MGGKPHWRLCKHSLCISGGVDVCASDFLLLIINSFFWESGKWRCMCVGYDDSLLLLRVLCALSSCQGHPSRRMSVGTLGPQTGNAVRTLFWDVWLCWCVHLPSFSSLKHRDRWILWPLSTVWEQTASKKMGPELF